MTSEKLGEMFEGDSADTHAGKFPLMSMRGRANGEACADGERGPHRHERNFLNLLGDLDSCLYVFFLLIILVLFPIQSLHS